MPVLAKTTGAALTVTFSENIVPGPIPPGSFDMILAGNHYFQPDPGVAGPTNEAIVDVVLGDPASGPNRCNYFATPPSIRSAATGAYAAAFTDYPCTET